VPLIIITIKRRKHVKALGKYILFVRLVSDHVGIKIGRMDVTTKNVYS
jgi:hypothetical protein